MIVLDTDVCIEIMRGNGLVIERRRRLAEEVVTTWVTVAELYFGAAKSRWPEHNRDATAAFLGTIRVLGLDDLAARAFGRWKAIVQRNGRRVADADLLIAGVSLSHGARLATGNRAHYERVDELVIEDWLEGAR